MENFSDLGSRFSKYLEYKDLGVNEIAKILGFSGSQISNIKNGRVFGTDKAFIILNTFQDLDANWLFRNEGEMIKPNMQKMLHNESVTKSVTKNVTNQKYKRDYTSEEQINAMDIAADRSVDYGKPQEVGTLREQVQDLKERLIEQKELYTGQLKFLTNQIENMTKDKDERIQEYRDRIRELKGYIETLKNVSPLDDSQEGVG